MDEAVEMIITNTKLQNIQTMLSFFISGTNNFFFYIIPFLFKAPSILNENITKNFCEENNNNNNTDINDYINKKISIKNCAIIYQLFCDENKYKIQVLIFLYFLIKGISSMFFGYLIDKIGRKIILFYLSIISIFSFFCLFLSLFSYYFLIISFILLGLCSFFYIFSAIITCEFFDRNKGATISSLNICSGPFFGLLFVLLLKMFNNLNLLYILFIIFSLILFFYINKYFNESLYYLISKNKINECFNLLEKISELNDRKNLYDKIEKERYINDKIKSFKLNINIIDIFNYNSQKHRLINHILLWIFSSFSFYGIFNILLYYSPLDNFFLKYIIFYTLCILSQFISGIISDIYGRRSPLTYLFYISAISFLIFILTEEKIMIKNIFFFICIISSSSIYSLLFIFSSEDFPTCIRGNVLGFLFCVSQIIALIIYFIDNFLILGLIISLSNCIGGRIVESMEDTFELLLDDTFPEMYKNDNLKKKKYRALKCERISTGSDLYFLTSDDDAFNQETQTKYF